MSTLPTPNRYLTDSDYNLIIQQSQKSQIIQNNTTTLLQMERVAIEEFSSFIRQRYDTDIEFSRNVVNWSPLLDYNPGDVVTILYPSWSHGVNYPIYTCVTYNSISYIAKDNINWSSPELTPAQDTTNWAPLGWSNSFYNAAFPYPEFSYNGTYEVGDKVYWNGYIWTATSETIKWTSSNLQQYYIYSNVPQSNIAPDDIKNNASGQYWNNKTFYIVPAYASSPGAILTDGTYWAVGDSRCQQAVMYLIDMTVYHLHRTIAPNNIPELRVKAYKDAIEWLKEVARGYVAINFPQLSPKTGTIRSFGGNIKFFNRY